MGLDLVEPRGAFYASLRFASTGLPDEEFAERLLTGGEGRRGARARLSAKAAAEHMRVCYAQKYDLLEEAMRRMRRFVSRAGPP